MRRKPTESQRLAAAERRDRFRALARQIASLGEADRAAIAARSNVATIDGRALSTHNTCLVISQRPTATIVGGFRQWIAAGRAVRRGERGISIWVPCAPSRAKQNPTDGSPPDTDTYFVPGVVFDVSQTDEIGGAN